MTLDVAAFYRGEIHPDAGAIRAACAGGPLRTVARAWLLGPDAIGPAGWSAPSYFLALAEPVPHPRAPERSLTILPLAPGADRSFPGFVAELLQGNARLARLLEMSAPAVIVDGERHFLRLRVGVLFGLTDDEPAEPEPEAEAPSDRAPRAPFAPDPGSIVGVFCKAIADRPGPWPAGDTRELTVEVSSQFEETLQLVVSIRRPPDGAWTSDGAFLHASEVASQGSGDVVADVAGRFAELWIADLAANLAHHVARFGDGLVEPRGIIEQLAPTFQAIDLLERRAALGPPKAPTVTARRIDRLTSSPVPKLSARSVKMLRKRSIFAAFAIGDAVLLLGDTPEDGPWTDAFIGLVLKRTLSPILVSDSAGGTHEVIDGDPWRLRLFLRALRDAVRAAGLERTVLAPLPMPVDTWLEFGLPDIGERLVDPAAQWYVVDASDEVDEDSWLFDGADVAAATGAYHAFFDGLPKA